MLDRVRKSFREGARVYEALAEAAAAHTVEIAQRAAASLRNGGKILSFGNGGSAADAQHLAAELVNRYRVERPPLAGVALTTDTSAITAIANDCGFELVFEKQVMALARPGDLAVGFSTSGSSPNVLRALRSARDMDCLCIGLTGLAGGEVLEDLCHYVVRVPSRETPRVQEGHVAWIHAFCDVLEELLYPAGPGGDGRWPAS